MSEDEKVMQGRKIRLMKIAMGFGVAWFLVTVYIALLLHQAIYGY